MCRSELYRSELYVSKQPIVVDLSEALTGQRAEEEAAEREHIDNPNILADCNC